MGENSYKNQLETQFFKLLLSSKSGILTFRVGAAVLTSKGDIIVGANVENASYGAAICAERTALTRCVMEGLRSFQAIAIASDQEDPISPCGICRQFIREFGLKIDIHMVSNDGKKVVKKTLEELLPMSFGPENLGK